MYLCSIRASALSTSARSRRSARWILATKASRYVSSITASSRSSALSRAERMGAPFAPIFWAILNSSRRMSAIALNMYFCGSPTRTWMRPIFAVSSK